MFNSNEKSTFKYWFAHWCAFNMTALNLGVWKAKYLFHDIEKPFLKLFLPYEKVRELHRKHNKHHPEWLENKLNKNEYYALAYINKYDYDATIIDWECSRFTKLDSQLTAYDEYVSLILDSKVMEKKYPNLTGCHYYNTFKDKLQLSLKKLGLWK